MIRRLSRRRWLFAAAVVATVVAGLGVAFLVPPAVGSDELPRSIIVDGVVHERVHLEILTTTLRRETVTVRVPATSRPIVVRASCRLAVLHTSSAMSVFGLEMWWSRTGGNVADLPDTEGAEYLVCHPGWKDEQLAETIDPTWLPRKDDQLQLTWSEMGTYADTPSDSPASWAVAIYMS